MAENVSDSLDDFNDCNHLSDVLAVEQGIADKETKHQDVCYERHCLIFDCSILRNKWS